MENNRNRGKEGRDDLLFGTVKMQNQLKEAVVDMQYLLSRGYAQKSSLQLVGNRYRLNTRQQKAVQGMSASQQQIIDRNASCIPYNSLKNKNIIIDGFNLIIILESALSNAYIFKGLDNYYRDLASVHGTYKRVRQTEEALLIIGDVLEKAAVNNVLWVFDKPVSNSGRLKTILCELALKMGYKWEVILEYNPDKYLANSDMVVISSDAWILDRAKEWYNFIDKLINEQAGSIKPKSENQNQSSFNVVYAK